MLKRHFDGLGFKRDERDDSKKKKGGDKGGSKDDDGFPAVHDRYMIYGGPSTQLTMRQRKREHREVFAARMAVPQYLNWSSTPITFDREDHPLPQLVLLDMLPLLGLFLVVEEYVGLGRIGGSPDTNPIGAPVLRLCPDRGRGSREEPRWGGRAVHRQIFPLIVGLLRRWWYQLGWTLRQGLERPFLLAPLLLLQLLLLLLLLPLGHLLLLLLLLLLLTLLLLLQLLWRPRRLELPLLPLFLFLLLLLEGSKASRQGSPSRDERSRRLLLHRLGVPRRLVTTRRVVDGDGVRLDPQSGGLGDSFLPLSLGRLVTRRHRRSRLRTRRSTLSVGRRLKVGGACEIKSKGRSL